MFVILTYDVSAKRTSKVLKTCRKYLTHVQRSVFEGVITPAKLEQLKGELARVIVAQEDGIQIYKLESLRYSSKDKIGKDLEQDHIF